MKNSCTILILFLASMVLRLEAQKRPVDYVNTFLGTAPLTNSADIGFNPAGPDWSSRVRRCPTPWCS